jgi:ABC-type transport system involved in multi-copper enzyme maturation permease subunit
MQLVVKDIEQHGKQVLGLVGLLALALGTVSVALRPDPLNAYLTGILAFALLGLLPVQLGQWLVGHERLQRTIKFLKMIPVSAQQVVLAKFAAGWLFLTASFLLFCVLPFLVATYGFQATSAVSIVQLLAVYPIGLIGVSFCLTLNFLVEKQAVAPVFFAAVVLLAVGAAWLAQRHHLLDGERLDELAAWAPFIAAASLVLWTLIVAGLYGLAVLGYRRIRG